jgi:group I intron endonuclease
MKKIGIYKITSPSNKIYIGQSSNIDQRIKDYRKTIHCKGQVRLYNSLIKYGFENHSFEVIEYCQYNDLNKRERYWQDFYDVINLNGLNCKLTPCEGKKMELSKEARKKISDKVKINQPMRRPEVRIKFSQMWSGENNPMYNAKGNLNPASKQVLDLHSGIFYDCIREAAESINIKYSTLKSMLNGTNRNKTSLVILK